MQQLFLGGFGGQQELEALHAAGEGLLALAADIDLARRVFADQHHRKARLAPGGFLETGGDLRHFAAQGLGKSLAVDDRGSCHTAA